MRKFLAIAPNGAIFIRRRFRTQTHAVLVRAVLAKTHVHYDCLCFCTSLSAAEKQVNANKDWADSRGWQMVIVEVVR